MSADPRFLKLLDEIKELHIKKNAGYAGVDSEDAFRNFRFSELFGVSPFIGCMVRMSDKFIRVSNLVKNPNADQVEESITDTLMDLAVYSLIGICLFKEERSKSKNGNK